jgi:hypothetical protein
LYKFDNYGILFLTGTVMANAVGEVIGESPQLDFGRRLMQQCHGSVVASDTGLPRV